MNITDGIYATEKADILPLHINKKFVLLEK